MSTTNSEDQLIRTAAARVSVPRTEPADSFVLHAPLELMARVGLLPLVGTERRADARRALADLVDRYEAAGPPADDGPVPSFPNAGAAAVALDAAIRSGDLGSVDGIVCWLAANSSPVEIRSLVSESIVDSLAAAGHAPIALDLLTRVDDGSLPPALLRGPLRELSRNPNWRLTWFRSSVDPVHSDAEATSLAAAIEQTPHLGRPGSDFIFPLMSQIEGSGVAARLLGPTLSPAPDIAAARRTIQRAAVWSMQHDDPSQAPYGWSHALTMPQAVLSLAGNGVDARTAVAVAATFLMGFRAAHGTVSLGSLADDAPVARRDVRSVVDLAGNAACHHDAHLVKYTLACVFAAEDDPAWRDHYLAAATTLAEWWEAADSDAA
jgi:hypothetical protein